LPRRALRPVAREGDAQRAAERRRYPRQRVDEHAPAFERLHPAEEQEVMRPAIPDASRRRV
jgi:hypothetical protein